MYTIQLNFLSIVLIENVYLSIDNCLTDNNAKINELKTIIKQMNKQLDKVTEST